MKQLLALALACLLFTACKKDTEKTETTTETTAAEDTPALAFENKVYEQKSSLLCKDGLCTYVTISVPEASGMGDVSTNINNKIFHTTREIVYFGEKPTDGKSYKDIMDSFIKSYDEITREDPGEAIPWEAKIKATIDYQSDNIINVKLNNYMFTGGAHGYEGNRSLIFDAKTGNSLSYGQIFKDTKAFTAFAENKFRQKFSIPAGKSINSKDVLFENDKFVLPQNIFFKEEGLLLYYNPYEIGSFADGTKELLISYTDAAPYLIMK